MLTPLVVKMDKRTAREARRGGKCELALVRRNKKGEYRLVTILKHPAGVVAYTVEPNPEKG